MNINGSGIYKIINITNGKFYIGSARNFRNRWNSHKYHLIRNQHENSHLQNAWNKYGENQFKFEIIEECPINTLLMREQFYIDLYKPYDNTIGYNILRIAGSSLGFKFSEESRVKMSVAKQGKKLRLGAILSKETKEKISIANKGKIRTKRNKRKNFNS
ncbi:MAG: GIY-YIG nuclease family protein [Richelia sp. RM2_1_2]|nr:GIY-YIG nuclease family protein [Richelia sp. RM2_1_2]